MINLISIIRFKQLCGLCSTEYELKHIIQSFENVNNVQVYFQNTNDNSELVNGNIMMNCTLNKCLTSKQRIIRHGIRMRV